MARVVCIICGKEKRGIKVRVDRVIRAIRWFKTNVTKNEQDNVLVVCKEDYPTYKKYRSRYTSRQALYMALGVIFFVVGNLAGLGNEPWTLLVTLAVLAFFYLLSLLNYTPGLDVATAKQKQGRI